MLQVRQLDDTEERELVVFRILKDDSDEAVILKSLWSHYQLGKAPKPERETAVVHMGISTFGTIEQARSIANAMPEIGRYVAPLRLVPSLGFAYTTETGRRGHVTVWGWPAELRSVLGTIVPVEG
jgi:hypothetical protein